MNKFRIVERVFSENEHSPTILIANIKHSPSVAANMKKMEEIIQIAHQRSVNIVVFPELSVSGYIWPTKNEKDVFDVLSEGENEKIKNWLNNIRNSLSGDTNVLQYVFYGNARRQDGVFYNSTFILSPGNSPNERYFYDKVFLTPSERQYFQQGTDKRLSIDTKWGRIGVLICYDLCFVEMPRRYAFDDGVDAIITIAAWQSEAIREYESMNVRTDHYYGFLWDLMNSSKAAYNQIWSVGANWVGAHNRHQETFWGGSGLWAPSGLKLLQGSNVNEELLIVRHVNIKKQREQERDDFDYRIDFGNFYQH